MQLERGYHAGRQHLVPRVAYSDDVGVLLHVIRTHGGANLRSMRELAFSDRVNIIRTGQLELVLVLHAGHFIPTFNLVLVAEHDDDRA